MFKLSPSDFAFLWKDCKRCFWLKVNQGIRQPSMPMAGIFKKIEGLQMDLYDGKRTEEVLPELPTGIIRCGEKWVESDPMTVEGAPGTGFITGKIDSLIEFDDGTWGVLDFKTTETSPEKAELYARQLHAYAYCLENPAKAPRSLRSNPLALSPIKLLGILCFEPSRLTLSGGRHSYEGDVKWIGIPRDDRKFLSFISETLKVLSSPIPDVSSKCDWCKYAQRMTTGNFGNAVSPETATEVTCPQCGAPMSERTGKFGKFLGCTKYPECKGTRKI